MQKYLLATRIAALLCAVSPWSSSVYAATITAKPSLITDFADGGFEQPAIGAAAIVLNPASTEWTFAGSGVGYASNGSAFYNPTAPTGTQVLYIQSNAGSTTQSFYAATGRYRVTFKASQRPIVVGNNQTILVTIDNGTPVAITPPTTAFTDQAFEIDLAGGTHTLKLSGQAAGDHTAFVDGVALTPISYLANGSFEVPGIGAGAIVQAPSGSGWSFSTVSAGFASNGSGFGNANAPSGTQVLYIQGGTAYASRTVNANVSARYRLTFKAAQRPGNAQTILVTIDGTTVGKITPAGSAFEAFDFDGLLLAAGPHELKFTGQNGTGDNTAFLDDVALVPAAAGARAWNDPNTWDLARVPVAGDAVVVPSNARVILDAYPDVATVSVAGELHCADQNAELLAESVSVTGRFICGSRFSPYTNYFVMTLKGNPPGTTAGMGTKVFGVMSPGVVEFHGENRTSWTQLRSTASVGATQIALAAPTTWRAGDIVVIAPTREAANEGEVRKISSINHFTNVATFGKPLEYAHFGERSNYTDGSVNWTLDERAEVGLLSRNIRIQGDANSAAAQFGGHMMSMSGTTVHVSGVEFYQMGQKSLLGRYPFHWHIVGDAPGQYVENSSVHESYNRCIVVHRTNKVRVADNVCYDFLGHGYFLEDGNEQYNVFDGNLGIWARRPVLGEQILETDLREAPASNGPAVFWISNPTNTFTNNAAAGSQGTGYWYHLEATAVPGTSMIPNVQPFGLFDNNRAHSGRQGFSSCREAGNVFGMDSANVIISKLTVSNVGQGVWPCASNPFRQNATFIEAVVANTPNGMQAPTPFTFLDSIFIGHSANEPPAAAELAETPWFGIALYDQGFIFDRVRFVNYDRRNMSAFATVGGAGKLANNRVSRLSFDNAPNRYLDLNDAFNSKDPSQWNDVLHDIDGSLTGLGPGFAVVTTKRVMSDPTCTRLGPGFDGYACPHRYAQFRLDFSQADPNVSPSITQLRSDGVYESLANMPLRFLAQIAPTSGFHYKYRFDAGIARRDLDLRVINGFNNDTSVHEILDVPSTLAVNPSAWEPMAPNDPPRTTWTAASSLSDLMTGPGRRYYHNTDSSSLYVKMLAQGTDWHAYDIIRLCMTALPCSAVARSVAPPSVTITSADRVAAAPPPATTTAVTVTANISDPTGITGTKLFVNDVNTAVDNVAPFQYALNLATGTYVLKLVAKNGSNQTYTAIQTLTVGEPVPYIVVSSPANNATLDASVLPSTHPVVSYTASAGMVPPGFHLHLLDNGVDKGDIGPTTLQLASFDQGRHDLEIAWARPDDRVIAGGERRTIYVARDGRVADFEDGIDRRGSFAPDLATGTPGPFYYAWGLPRIGRYDGGAIDINFYSTRHDPSNGPTQSRFSLALTPAQNWNGYQSLEISHIGPAVDVYVKRAGGTTTNIGTAPASGVWTGYVLSLASVTRNDIVGIELRQNEPLAPAPPTSCATAPYPLPCYETQHLAEFRLLP